MSDAVAMAACGLVSNRAVGEVNLLASWLAAGDVDLGKSRMV